MKVKIDSFLRAETLGGATIKEPKTAKVVNLKIVLASELPFKSEEDKYELTVELGGELYTWFPNKTSLRAIVTAHGDESDNWVGKELKLYSVTQNVSGEMKEVIYAKI